MTQEQEYKLLCKITTSVIQRTKKNISIWMPETLTIRNGEGFQIFDQPKCDIPFGPIEYKTWKLHLRSLSYQDIVSITLKQLLNDIEPGNVYVYAKNSSTPLKNALEYVPEEFKKEVMKKKRSWKYKFEKIWKKFFR